MRYALIADIHANLAALTAIMADIECRGWVGEVWCLGDVVGYGPDPHQCIEYLKQFEHVCVAGNHDWAAVGKISTSEFNPDAAAACHWTAQQLNPEDVKYLESLPTTVQRGDFTLVHGSPRKPIWEYLLSTGSAQENFTYFKSPFCLIGHSHVPLIFESDKAGCSLSEFPANDTLMLAEKRLIINPGGAGQPRDGDPRASYAIYDSEMGAITRYCVPYDIGATQTKMEECGLPASLVARLSYGV